MKISIGDLYVAVLIIFAIVIIALSLGHATPEQAFRFLVGSMATGVLTVALGKIK